ncbi:MAG: SidA/IucD/PvdA family monooxygenase [Alphaproteobacteria bacterium]|nr:SidA/IucD/PvdA family monooxygenase [Alphaproteobacteria bacterium]
MTLADTLERPRTAAKVEHFDVLIVGAGISGVGAAYHLQDQMPGKTFVALDSLESFGGTWLTHKYPGIRSDSDLYTFGYRFKPWVGPPIATAPEILKYMREVIEENDLARHIRYKHKVLSASWSSADNRWTVEAERTDTGERHAFTCNFLWMCQGYYKHDAGFMPEWPGMEDFKGTIVHAQTWPEGLDYKGKRVVVIGSGATAATVIPAMAKDVEHITMLQRSPTFFFPAMNRNELADILREIKVEEPLIHDIVRKKMLYDQEVITRRCLEEPEAVTAELIEGVRAFLGPDYDVATHFTPRYRPWRQRVAFVPDGDLFQGIASGKASVVTDEIERFTKDGILTKSGQELKADIIVAATGFHMCVLGDVQFDIDGKPVDFSETVNYRGMMFTGVPNMLWIFGYFRASWTLRVDMLADFVVRLLKHMDANGYQRVEVALRKEDHNMPLLPWIDAENFNPNYLLRAMHQLPKRGDKPEWQHNQDYWRERDEIPLIDLNGAEYVYR